MPLRRLVAAFTLLIACAAPAAGRGTEVGARPGRASLTAWRPIAPEPPATRLVVGDRAPEFSYIASDGHWHPFYELLGQGPILLVFGAADSDLTALEEARAMYRDLGVKPVVVADRSTRSSSMLSRRLKLTCPIISDPILAIADLYNSVDPVTLRHAPAFFVVDSDRTIRALLHGPLPTALRMLTISAFGLGRPLPETGPAAASG